MPTSRRIALLLASCAATTAAAQQPPRVFDGAPPASWIAPPDVPGNAYTVFHARRTIDLPSAPARFVVHVSADNLYRLYVNGEPIASGPQRSDVMHWRYETVDLAPRLRAGRNVIAALVWNWGPARPVAQHSFRTGFLLQGHGASEAALVNTGPGWKLLRDTAYAPVVITNATVAGYYAAAPGDSVEGARYPWGWERPEYADDGWYTVAPPPRGGPAAPMAAFDVPPGSSVVGRVRLHAVPPGGTGEMVGWQLEPRSLPPMEETVQRLARVRRATGVPPNEMFLRGAGDLVIPARTTATLLLDQSHTTNAYPVLETSGGAGSRVTLTYAEALVDARGQKGHRDSVEGRTIRGVRDVFLPDGGARRRFRPLYWRSFRYVELRIVTGDAPLSVHDLHGVFTAYPFAERARFAAADAPWLADVWRISWNGARIGAFDTYMDTPYYEQLQYVGDTRVQALISLYAAGDDRLARQAIEHFDASRIPEGITASRYPSEVVQLIPPFSLIYVAMVHDYLMHRADAPFVRERLAGIRGILDWYGRRVDSTGLVGETPYWNYVDWARQWRNGVPPGADHGHSTTITLLYAYALQRAAALEAAVGARGMGAAYRSRADSLVAAVRARSWDAGRRLFRDSPDTVSFSQQTNVLAVLTGAVPAAERRALMERVLSDTSLVRSTYYFSFYVLEALREAGLADRYLAQLAPWRDMLALGLTSTPENPEPTRSDTHAWAAHPIYGLLATVLGVRPASPGFGTVRIAPALGTLRGAEGRVAHPAGDIDVKLARVGASGLRAEVTLPAGVSGTLEWNGRRAPLRAGRQVVRL